jgi:4,5-DOPA dioxygenase extradiol
MNRLPALFISHGMPSMALAPGPTGRFLADLPRRLARPEAIVCISAHLEGTKALLTADERPETVHDFGGFGAALQALRYPAPGCPDLAARIVAVLRGSGIPADLLPDRGFDHGAWVPLLLMYPKADIPVVQLSVQTDAPPAYHFELGRQLAPLREEGVLVLASGGATHDLTAMADHRRDDPPAPYAAAFDHWLETVLTAGAADALLSYRESAPEAERNHPFPAEHFLPLITAAGAGGEATRAVRLHRHFAYGVLSLAAYRWD